MLAPRQRFVFFPRRRTRRRVKYTFRSTDRRFAPDSFSFSDIDIGEAFQFIIHMPVASCHLSSTYD